MTSTGEDSRALLPLQRGMLLHLFADPHSGIDIQQCIGRVRERLDFEKFARAWQQVTDRHSALRAWFRLDGVECTQHIATGVRVKVALEDWRGLSPAARGTELEKYLEADRAKACKLTESPIWHVTVFDCGDEGFRFVCTQPHAIVDATSAFIMLRDLFSFYDGQAPTQTAGCFTEFMRVHARRDIAAAEACWREVFRGFAGHTGLCIPRPDEPLTGQGSCETTLEPRTGALIRAISERERLPLSAIVKAAWCVLLSRLSGTDDVVFGEVRSGRRKDVPNMENMIGMFVTTVPVRMALPTRITFRELIGELRKQQSSVREHEQTAPADIQRWCGLAPDKPLFETAVVFDHMSVTAAMKRDGGAWLNRDISHRERTSVPITLNVTAEPDFTVKISYDRCRFSDNFMRRLPGYFQAALEAFADNPDCAVAKINILPQAEHARVLQRWNSTTRTFDASTTIPQAFAKRVQLHPGRIAVICGDRQMSYRELENSTNALATAMREQGVAQGSLVGICIDRSIDMLVAMLATMKAGGGYVPLDPSYPDERLRFMVEDARPTVIVAGEKQAERFVASGARIITIDTLHVPHIRRAKQATLDAARAEDLAYVIYTSGSTGRPKGVMITQRNVANCFAGMDAVLPAMSTGTWLAVTSISFDISVIELFWTLTRGYTVVICRDSADAPEITRLLKSKGVSHLQCTPSLARILVTAADTREALKKLRVVMLGGEPLPEDLLEQLGRGRNADVINVYGPTETTIWSTAAHVSDDITLGRPIANTQLYVLDPALMPLPVGIPGELYIAGAGVARGYLNRDELTSERFLPDPFVAGDGSARMYRTGDLVRYRDDGLLVYLGRLDNQVKISGHRIELGEVESALQRQPQIVNAAVVARDDHAGQKQLAAYVTLAPGYKALDNGKLREALRNELPEYEIPAAFIVLASLPLTPNLKIDRKALANLDHVPRTAERSAFTAPRTSVEQKLAQLWQDVLGVERISVTENFFTLGGNSLKAVQVILGVRERLGIELATNLLYQHSTIEALAARLQNRSEPSQDAWAVWQHYGDADPNPAIIGLHGVDDIFVPLARQMLLPVHTLTSRVGFDGSVAPYFPCRSVEDMAERYLAGLRSVQPKGPYMLMGFCLGGLITYEVAIRLTEAGEKVAFLGLFNSPPPREVEESRATRASRHLRLLASLGVREQAGYVWRYALHNLRILGTRFRRSRIKHSNAVTQTPAERLVAKIAEAGLQMVGKYRHRAYPGRVHLFHGAYWPKDYVERWSRLAGEGASACLLPGGHITMMEEPHVQEVAVQLTERLTSMGIQATPPATSPSQEDTAEALRLARA